MILDPNTEDGIPIILEANSAAIEIHGYSREEFIGRPVSDIDDEDGKKLVREKTALIMEGNPFYVENTHIRKDGSTFDVAVNAQRIDIGNNPPLVFSTEYDITDKNKAEAILRNQQELISTSTRLTQIGGWEIDLGTGESSFTRETYLIYGLDPDDPSPSVEAGIKYFAPETTPIIKEMMDRAIEDHTPYDVELPFINARGASLWVRILGEVEVQGGKAVRLFGAMQDITERKQSEVVIADALLEAKKANEVKDQFVANIEVDPKNWTVA